MDKSDKSDRRLAIEVVIDSSPEARDGYREAIRLLIRRIREERSRSLPNER